MAIFSIPFSGFGSEFELYNANENAISKTISQNDLSSDTINTQKIIEEYAKEYVLQFSILYKIPVTFKYIVFKNNMSGSEKIIVDINDNYLNKIKQSIDVNFIKAVKNTTIIKQNYKNLNMFNTSGKNITAQKVIDDESVMIAYMLLNNKVCHQDISTKIENTLSNIESNIINKMKQENSINNIVINNIIETNNDLDEMFKHI